MKHGQRPLGILVHPDRGVHRGELVRVLRDLETVAVIVPRVVRGHDSFFLDTEERGEGRADPRDKGGAGLLGLDRTARSDGWEKPLDQQSIGGRHVRETRQGQFLRPPIVARAEHALRSAPRVG